MTAEQSRATLYIHVSAINVQLLIRKKIKFVLNDKSKVITRRVTPSGASGP
jgi:hypothetical protein